MRGMIQVEDILSTCLNKKSTVIKLYMCIVNALRHWSVKYYIVKMFIGE